MKYFSWVDHSGGLGMLVFGGVLRRLAVSMLSIFTVVYLYGVLGGVFLVLLFFLILFVSKLVFLFFSENLSQRIGFKHVMRLSIVPFVLFIPMLIFGPKMEALLWIGAVFWGAQAGLFWWGYHGYFSKVSDNRHFGLNVGRAGVAYTIERVISPILGALIVFVFGFNTLFIFSGILMTLAIIVIGSDGDVMQKHDIKFFSEMGLMWRQKISFAAYLGRGIELFIYGTFWPLYIYLVLGGLLKLGGVLSAGILLAAVLSVWVGKYIDRRGERRPILLSTPLVALSWLVRLIAVSPVFYIFSDTVRGFGERIVDLSLDELSYRKASEGRTGAALMFREFGISLGAAIGILLLMVVVSFTEVLSVSFVVAFVAALSPLLLVYSRKV
jgi:MFS family permease